MTTTPSNFVVVIWTWHKDIYLVPPLVSKLKSFHPGLSVLIQIDGDTPSSYVSTLTELGCAVHHMKHRKVIDNNNAFLFERWSDVFRAYPDQLFIRLDPDTEVHRPISPIDADWFGQVFDSPTGKGVWGGAMGIKREVIKELLSLEPQSLSLTYYSPDNDLLPCDDTTLAYYLNDQLGILPTEWPGLAMQGRFTSRLLLDCWDITHPSLEKRCKAHWPERITVDPALSATLVYRLASSLGQSKYNRPISVTEHRDYFVLNGLYCLDNDYSMGHGSRRYSTLVVECNGQLTIDSHPIGHIQEDDPLDVWFSQASCDIRKSLM